MAYLAQLCAEHVHVALVLPLRQDKGAAMTSPVSDITQFEPGAVLSVEVLVEQQVVLPGRVVQQPVDPPEAGTPPVRADHEQRDKPILQVHGD
jgi:hypothetical protein